MVQIAEAVGQLFPEINHREFVNNTNYVGLGRESFLPGIKRHIFQTVGSFSQFAPDGMLTPMQLEVLRLVARGATNRQISERLFMNAAAVKRETNAIFAKLGVSNIIQAVAKAYKRNIL